MTTNQPYLLQDDLLWRQLKSVPAFRGLLRAVESRFYRHIELPGPILDVGCGDGHFAQMTFDHPLDVGIDPWWGPLQKAQRSGQYAQVLQGMGDRLPFPDHTFASAISNSVLEHIPDVQPVLNEIGRVLRPGGRLVITMPSHHFTQNLAGAAFFTGLGLPGLANRYRQLFNFISRHAHTDAAEVWAARLAEAGFAIDRWQYYFSPGALRALEWGHVQGLPAALLHALTGHWIVAPWERSLRRTERWLRPFYAEEAPPNGAYVLFMARKIGDGPVAARLPAARPFSVAELERERERELERELGEEWAQRSGGVEEQEEQRELEIGDEPEVEQEETGQPPESRTPSLGPGLVTGGLTLLALLFAALGQANLRGGLVDGAGAWRQFGLSAFFVLLLWAYRRGRNGRSPSSIRLPRLTAMPRQRLLVAPALLSSLLALSSANAARPWLAFLLWFAAIGLALFALWPVAPRARTDNAADPYGNLIALGLFVMALLLRTINLEGLPFILNGTEAMQGLEGMRIVRGEWLSPFSSSGQGYPALPFFLLALPLQLFGPTVVSLRLLAPLVGALTVVVTFWLGQRLWGRAVGLVAAVLLLGSHWHLHYSRLGLTTIWEPLLALLALGLVAVAWQEKAHGLAWLAAGTAVGLSFYFVGDPRLVPLTLGLWGLLMLLIDRARVLARGRGLLAAGILALVVALPQLLHNQAQPAPAWQQANILYPGNNWLAQRASGSGETESAILRQQAGRGLRAFFTADNSPSYRTQNSLLGFGMGLLLVLGVITAVFHLRQARTVLLLVWVGVAVVFTAVLLPDPPQSDRLLVVTPALALLSGFGLVTLAQWQQMPLIKNRVLLGTLGVAAVLALSDGWYYYGRYPAENSFADRNTEIAHRVSDYLNNFDDTWTVYFYGPPTMYGDFPTITFLAPQFRKNYNLFDVDPTSDGQLAPTTTAKTLFIFLPERAQEAEAIRRLYPGGQARTFSGVFANPLFYSHEINGLD